MMKSFNVTVTGVGGQGIGMLSEVVLRAADLAGLSVKSVDTHGLAQRGGIVVSQIRLGEQIHAPLIPAGQADLVVSLERHEALRAAVTFLKEGGTLIYYNTAWQPLPVRLNEAPEITEQEIAAYCRKRTITVYSVFKENLSDTRMQNMVVLAELQRRHLIPGIRRAAYEAAMKDLMRGPLLERNIALLHGG